MKEKEITKRITKLSLKVCISEGKGFNLMDLVLKLNFLESVIMAKINLISFLSVSRCFLIIIPINNILLESS